MSRKSLLVACLLVIGCHKPGAPSSSSSGKTDQESLLDVVPDDALAAAVVRADALRALRKELEAEGEMHREMKEFLVKRVGVDLTPISAVVAFMTGPKDGAAFFRMPVSGTPKWQKGGEVDGTPTYKLDGPVWAALVPRGLYVGTEAGVKAGVLVALGKAPALKKASALGAMLDVDPAAVAILGATPAAVDDPAARPIVALYGIGAVVFGFAPTHVFAWVSGDPARLAGARDAAKSFIDLAAEKSKEEHDTAIAGDDTVRGLAAIAGYHGFRKLAPKITPKLVGDRLTVDYPFSLEGEGSASTMMMTTVAVVGILAAIAIPAFMKYIRRSKTVEATMNVRKLYDGAVELWETNHQLPPSTDWTPATGCCGGPDHKCLPDAATFAGKTWQALRFSIDDPYRYQYRVTSTKAGFVVEARGDLDCDGVFSSFKRTGTIEAGHVSGGAGLESERDIE